MVPGPHQPGETHDGEPGRGGGCEVDGQVAADRVEHGDDRLNTGTPWFRDGA